MRFMAGTVLTVSLLAAGDAAAQVSYGQLFMSPMGEPYRSETEDPPIVAWFAAADTDQDQRLSRAEFVDRANVFFTRVLDANHDGGATSAESTTFWRLRAPEVLAARAPAAAARASPTLGIASNAGSSRRRQERDPPRRGAAMYGILFEAEPVMSCDADMSRRVTAEEFQACATRRFEQIDVDGDGYFTIAESPRASELAGLE